MLSVKDTWRRLSSLHERHSFERGLDAELHFHIEQQTERYIAAGLMPDEARRQALLKFGGIESTKERTRDQFRAALLEDSARDLRYGLRVLRRTPGFTFTASFTLALGIGGTIAVFTIINGVLLKPLPYPHPEALVSVAQTAPAAILGEGRIMLSATQLFTYREHNTTFDEIGFWSRGSVTVTGGVEPEQVPALFVNSGTLRALGVQPALGRWFSQEDDAPGSPETVLVSDGYWHRQQGGNPSVIGQTIVVDSRPRAIVGVMPEGFQFLDVDHDLILPYRFDRSRLRISGFNYQGIARLKRGVTLDQANTDVARMIPIWLHAWPEGGTGIVRLIESARLTSSLRPLKEHVVGDVARVLWILMGTVGIVLVIACANVASLLLVRGEARQQELAVRAALGAGRGRLARQLFLEHLLLGVGGGIAGLALAWVALRLLLTIAPATLPRVHNIAIDPRVMFVALVVSGGSGLLAGLVPTLRHIDLHVWPALRSAGRSSDSPERHRARHVLVAAQIALSLVLLLGSGLMIRTFVALRAIQPGFTNPHQVQLIRLGIPAGLINEPTSVFRIQNEIRERLAAIPGVTNVSFASSAPMEGFTGGDAIFVKDVLDAEGQVPPIRRFDFVSPGFFATLGIPLVAGRDFAWTDLEAHRSVAIISEAMARELWRDPARALGHTIRDHPENLWREIVGVVGDVYDDGVQKKSPTMVYWPILIENFGAVQVQRTTTFAIRGQRTGSEAFIKEIREAVRSVNPNLPLAQVRTLGDVYERSLSRTSFTLTMLAVAAVTALLLCLVGIYGVIAYTVSHRSREIGIRIALGAQHGELARRFVRNGLLLGAAGLASGLAASLPLVRVMTSELYGVSAFDPTTYLAVSLLVLGAAALASYIPARRTIAVDASEALRCE